MAAYDLLTSLLVEPCDHLAIQPFPMKLRHPLLALCLLFVACTATPSRDNPLDTARYNEELADTLANLVIMDDPIAKEEGMSAFINEGISDAKDRADDARARIDEGMQGGILSMKQDVTGYALYLSDRLYFSSDFVADPGPSLHVYLTQPVDPRDTEFPDPTALDLGLLTSAFGSQVYSVPHQEKPELYRTLVFWDTKLKRLYGFAQLSKR